MVKITKFGAWSVAKLFGVLYAALGFIAGAVIFLFSLIAMAFNAPNTTPLVGLGMLVLLPLLYGALGIVFGYLLSWLYNTIAKRVGGIIVDVENVETAA